MGVRRVFVEKKPQFAVKAKELKEEIGNYLNIGTVSNVRVLIRYDVENVSDAVYRQALATVFSEPPVDFVYEEEFPAEAGDTVFSVEYLPGQFDQRADSAEQCVKLLKEDEEPVIRTATTYVLTGALTGEQKAAVLAVRILAISDTALAARYDAWRADLGKKIVKANADLSEITYDFKTN